jgi:hypothetical protein
MLKALHDVINDQQIKESIDKEFIHNYGMGIDEFSKQYVKLHLNEYDDGIYSKD